MNYYDEIKNKLVDDEIYSRVKDYSKERHKVVTYFEIGRLLSEAGGKYGDKIIDEYSKKLVIEVGKKYNPRTLRSMRQLYKTFKDDFWKPLVSKLSWTNLLIIMTLKDSSKMYYYMNQCLTHNLSKRELQSKLKNEEYEKLPADTRRRINNKDDLKVTDFVKNPISIKTNKKYELISEKILQKLILEDIEMFMKELGDSFCFIGSEYKIKIGNAYNYIDLLLFNIEFNCYVVVELKVTELKKDHIGQVQVYMNYIDENIKKPNQNKTAGIIICKENNKFIIKYSSDSRIISREYMLV